MKLTKKDLDPNFDDEDFFALWPAMRMVAQKITNAFPKSRLVRWVVKRFVDIGDYAYSKGELEE